MSTLKQNKLTPVLGVVATAVVIYILYRAIAGGGDQAVKAGPAMGSVPAPPATAKDGKSKLPRTAPMADVDNASETMRSLVASNRELQAKAAQVIEDNRELRKAMEQSSRAAAAPGGNGPFIYGPPGSGTTSPMAPVTGSARTATMAPVSPVSLGETSSPDGTGVGADQAGSMSMDGKQKKPHGSTSRPNAFEQALDVASNAAESVVASLDGSDKAKPKPDSRRASTSTSSDMDSSRGTADAGTPRSGRAGHGAADEARIDGPSAGRFSYRAQPPMGYVPFDDKKAGSRGPTQVRYVRTLSTPEQDFQAAGTAAETATQAARNAAKLEAARYFTIPENATMVGARVMTTIIGRVPVDGRVTDPLPFKALIGRDNLAANGLELPPDVVGTIVSGVAIGDMALSCSEARVRSLTFVFNDGSIRTVSAKGGASSSGGSGGSRGDLGYLSDQHGNTCLPGTFVTNAPRYLADVVGFGALNAYGQSLAEAQTSVTSSGLGTTTTVVDPAKYALGRAAGSATGEVAAWIMSRLKNSFDAVVIPVPHDPKVTFTVNFEQEVALDKPEDARRLVHRQQQTGPQRGARYGLE